MWTVSALSIRLGVSYGNLVSAMAIHLSPTSPSYLPAFHFCPFHHDIHNIPVQSYEIRVDMAFTSPPPQ